MTKDDEYYEVLVGSTCHVLFRPDAFYVMSDLRFGGQDSMIYIPDGVILLKTGSEWIDLNTGTYPRYTSTTPFDSGYMFLAKNWQGHSW